jgi:predicted enzyme related to lactoylglutathione lyase
MGDSQGRFVWYDPLTSDVDGAVRFYRDVVGWGHARLGRRCNAVRAHPAPGAGGRSRP